MSKYGIAKEALENAISQGEGGGWDKNEMLLTIIVSAVNEYRGSAGKAAARDALVYELGELSGNIDTQLIRSR
jgi:hypothetical protein